MNRICLKAYTQCEHFCKSISFYLECNASFIHLIDFNMHVRQNHNDKPLNCPFCNKVLKRSVNSDIDIKHMSDHGFSLCHCAYCEDGFNDIESMISHLRDEHPTKLPYSFVRISSGSPTSKQQVSIAYFCNEQERIDLVHSPLTDLQVNFHKYQRLNYTN